MAFKSVFRHTLLTPRLWVISAMGAAFLSACATAPMPQQPRPVVENPNPRPVGPEVPRPEQPQNPVVDPNTETNPLIDAPEFTREGLTPPHMRGRNIKRLALLLPFSSRSERLRSEAASMLKAAEMAVFDRSDADVLIIALDTGGTPDGAVSATRTAVKSGVDVILGPVLAGSVRAASGEARRSATPLIAFSSDQSVAGEGTYLLSFPPEAEVERIVEYAASTGVQNFAFLGPQSTYGRRVLGAYQNTVGLVRGQVTASETYDGNDISVMQEPALKLSQFYKSREARNKGEGRRAFEAILLPEGGTALRSLAPLLPYYDVDPADVQFLGTGLWHKEETAREPALNGGRFAGPPQEARLDFIAAFDQQFGEDPSQLASLAHDAVIIGAVAGIMCQEMVNLIRNKFKIDDTLDVFAVHGVGGIFGTIMIAVFGVGSWAAQLGSLAIVGIFTTVVTVALIYLCKAITPLRVDHESENLGLDITVHGESAYHLNS